MVEKIPNALPNLPQLKIPAEVEAHIVKQNSIMPNETPAEQETQTVQPESNNTNEIKRPYLSPDNMIKFVQTKYADGNYTDIDVMDAIKQCEDEGLEANLSNVCKKLGVNESAKQEKAQVTQEKQMIKYCDDNKVAIKFSEIPDLKVRCVAPGMSNEEKNSIKKFPFELQNDVDVEIYDKTNDKTYKFNIPKGYKYDGASIPKIFHSTVGANSNNKFLIGALVHDRLCEDHDLVDGDRKLATDAFGSLLAPSGVSKFKRSIMKFAVNIYQKIFNNWDSDKHPEKYEMG